MKTTQRKPKPLARGVRLAVAETILRGAARDYAEHSITQRDKFDLELFIAALGYAEAVMDLSPVLP